MTPSSAPIFRPIKPGLEERLKLVFPELLHQKFTVETRPLQTRAGSLNQAACLTIHRGDGAPIECVEKSIFKFPGFRPAELAIHDELHVLDATTILRLPEMLGRIETPLAGISYTRLIRDEGVKLRETAAEAARGIAEIERLSHAHLSASPGKRVFRQLDFFQPWFRLRPRYHVGKALWMLDRVARKHPEATPLVKRLRALEPVIRTLEKSQRDAPRCFSHLDYFGKNLMRSEGSFYLLDWGEARVGRIGFDAGAWLHAMLRLGREKQFEKVGTKFLAAYLDALDPPFRNERTRDAITYLFTVRSLGYFLRPRILREASEKDTFDQLLRRLACVADTLEQDR